MDLGGPQVLGPGRPDPQDRAAHRPGAGHGAGPAARAAVRHRVHRRARLPGLLERGGAPGPPGRRHPGRQHVLARPGHRRRQRERTGAGGARLQRSRRCRRPRRHRHAPPGRRPDPGPEEVIRAAQPEDVPDIYRLIRALAEYERSLPSVTGTEDDLRQALFGAQPAVFAHVAEHDGGVVGFALWFLNYSTWTGHHGIYLEDLFVDEAMRGHGYGKALLAELARVCVERGYQRLEWVVLDWNTPSIKFYQSLGAQPMDDWDIYRLSGPALRALGTPGS